MKAAGGVDVQSTYERRFTDTLAFRRQMWNVLCREFFQQHVPADATVVEIGAGYCEFINHIRAGRKIAVDLNPDTRKHASAGVEVILASTSRIEAIALLRLYLKLKPAWRIFGQQSFLVATPRG